MLPIISFCSTCMNRSDQLKLTLEYNLNVLANYSGKIELVLVNFLIDDESVHIHNWIINLGKRTGFRYFYTTELESWHASIAKNTAHNNAEGRFLINLDCDNFIERKTIEALLNLPTDQLDNTIFSGYTGSFTSQKSINLGRAIKNIYYKITMKKCPVFLRQTKDSRGLHRNGTYGHIGLPKKCFLDIGGYNQSLPPMGGQDRDLLWRAYNFLENPYFLHMPAENLPIQNDKALSLANTLQKGTSWSSMNDQANQISKSAILNNELIANQNLNIGVPVIKYEFPVFNVTTSEQ